jgi:hypothetical protein
LIKKAKDGRITANPELLANRSADEAIQTPAESPSATRLDVVSAPTTQTKNAATLVDCSVSRCGFRHVGCGGRI